MRNNFIRWVWWTIKPNPTELRSLICQHFIKIESTWLFPLSLFRRKRTQRYICPRPSVTQKQVFVLPSCARATESDKEKNGSNLRKISLRFLDIESCFFFNYDCISVYLVFFSLRGLTLFRRRCIHKMLTSYLFRRSISLDWSSKINKTVINCTFF